MQKLVYLIFMLFICNTNLFAKIDFDCNTQPISSIDTVKIRSTDRTKSKGIPLQEVIIRGTKKLSKGSLEEVKSDYKDPYVYSKKLPFISVLGSPVTYLYNLFSKRGKNARKLHSIIESDYQKAEIDHRYTPSLVGSLTGLAEKELIHFMTTFRPSYEFVSKATDYDMLVFVKKSYQEYRQSHSTIPMAPSLIESEK